VRQVGSNLQIISQVFESRPYKIISYVDETILRNFKVPNHGGIATNSSAE